MTDSYANRLIHESSPYLQQHAHNPVDWYAWGEAAFDKAVREDKPVLLSIGYSTCHWCHVMEEEVFADAEAAALINRICVPVKVDREERPDIDQVYMKVSQMVTGAGGWPLNVFMTPDRQPFYAATYIPKRSRFGRPGVMELLPKIEQAWNKRRDEIVGSAEKITRALQSVRQAAAAGGSIEAGILDRTYSELRRKYDVDYGGFGDGQKFPMPHHLRYLLRHWQRSGEERALQMVEQTLTAMRFGGICDQVGFGFHRYATDRSWQLPHFEKMLYDQALIAMAYIEAHTATGKAFYADCAREIFTYVRRDLSSPDGLFYAAEDADSEGEEGRFYLWREAELAEVLGRQETGWFGGLFNICAGGNYQDEAGGGGNGLNILYGGEGRLADAARFEAARQKLLQARSGRVRPFRDEKILTDWNGLMIAALAMGGRALNEPEYTAAAATAARGMLADARRQAGRLVHCRYADGKTVAATLDDYAFLIWGLIELYQASMDVFFLRSALALQQLMQHDFADPAGGYFLNAHDAEALLIRPKEVYDGATPSGNSVALLNNLRLARLTGSTQMEQAAQAAASAMIGEIERAPSAYSHFVAGLDFALADGLEIVIAGDAGAADAEAMLQSLNRQFLPNAVILLRTAEEGEALATLAPYTSRHTPVDGRAAAYVCRGHSCSLPTTDIKQMQHLLQPQT